jgi:hypothetical protein
MKLTPKQIARAVPFMAAEERSTKAARSSIVAKRKANNDKRSKAGHGLRPKVADNDPMEKDSESNWP